MNLSQDKQTWAKCIERYKKKYEGSPITCDREHAPITKDDILSQDVHNIILI
jgi:hypothetical protein